MSETSEIVDAVKGSWVEHLPAPARPYAQLMRLDRPIGWWLLLLPCWWGLVLAQIAAGGGLPNLKFAALFLVGAIVMRGAGCTVNDIVDRDIDSAVERTRARPIPAGQVSVTQAVIFFMRSASHRTRCASAIQLGDSLDGDCFAHHCCDLSLYEAHHVLAAGGIGFRF